MTIYTMEAEDGTVRMALHDLRNTPGLCMIWDFRVVWLDNDVWMRSCRGRDALCTDRNDDDKPLYNVFANGFSSVDDAIMWLLEGEVTT